MALKCYLISCSSDAELNVSDLYVHAGESGPARWLAQTPKEIKKRLIDCRKKYDCEVCDAQVHLVEIRRDKTTLKQEMSKP